MDYRHVPLCLAADVHAGIKVKSLHLRGRQLTDPHLKCFK